MKKLSLYLGISLATIAQSQAQNYYPATGNVGFGTINPDYPLHIRAGSAVIKLDAVDSAGHGGIRGRNNTWILGYTGVAGSEELSLGTRDLTGARTVIFAAGGVERMKLLANGNFGIGLSNAAARLHIVNGQQQLMFATGTCTSGYTLSVGVNDDGINFSNNSTVRGFKFKNGNGTLLDISAGGAVGIGAQPQTGYKLAVNGDALFTKVQVKAYANWPDYVFDDAYELPSLQTLEKYIQAHKHLPDVPSAAEVAAGGIDLAEMNAKLLQKVEELTLYLIEQNKKLELQQREIDQLKQKL